MDIVYNWHITEKCNYSCKYCFSNYTSGMEIWKYEKDVECIIEGIKNSCTSPCLIPIIDYDSHAEVRINLAGGEPLVLGESLFPILNKAQKLGLKTSLITNGSLLVTYIRIARYIFTIGISIDSFSPEINRKIGRCTRDGKFITKDDLYELVSLLREINPDINVKFNTVVNRFNFQERIIPDLESFNPAKIKIFRELPSRPGQSGISDEMFEEFIHMNTAGYKFDNIYIEDNDDMTHSYLMIDPMGRFFQNGNGQKYNYSLPIRETGFNNALSSIDFNADRYISRYERSHDKNSVHA